MKRKLDKQHLLGIVKEILLILLVGAILALPFMRYGWGWLVCMCPIAFLYYVERLEVKNWLGKHKIRAIWAVGMVFFGLIMNWLYHIHATDLIQESLLRNIFVFITFFAVIAILASGFAIFAWMYFRFKLCLTQPRAFLYVPVLWAFTEFVRSVLFSIVWMGPGGTVGAHWNFGVLGFGASASPLVYAARLVGLFGLSILITALNMSVYNLIKRRHIWLSLGGLAIVSIIVASGWFVYKRPLNTQTRTVGLVHLQSDQDTGYERDLLASVRAKASPKADLLMLPEYSHFLESDEGSALDPEIVQATLRPSGPSAILTSRSELVDREHSNAVVVLDRTGSVQTRQFKRFLIPGGEYIPYIYQAMLALSGNTSVVSDHTQNKAIEKATTVEKPLQIGGVNFGVLACSGAIAPDFYRNLTRSGAKVLGNTASLSSMGIDKLYFEQAKQMARFIAVANARDFAQSARGGQSYIVDQHGQFTVTSQGDATQYLAGTVHTNSQRTAYSIWGEWFLMVGIVALICLTVSRKKVNLKRKRNNGYKTKQNSQENKKYPAAQGEIKI